MSPAGIRLLRVWKEAVLIDAQVALEIGKAFM